jgi:hypothetical protein
MCGLWQEQRESRKNKKLAETRCDAAFFVVFSKLCKYERGKFQSKATTQ